MSAPRHLTEPRILFYAVNGLGLGHVTRLLAIARAVRRIRERAQILFITTTEADAVIYREGFASVKIPSRSGASVSGIRPTAYNKLAHTVVMNTVAAFNPAILIADTFPAGASQELLSTLSWEMRRVFVYRAQLDHKARDAFFQSALGRYDLAIVPHDEGSETIIAPSHLRQVWTGPILIRGREEALPRAEARARLGLPDEGRLLYATVGGGGDNEMALSEGIIFDAARDAGWIVVAPEAPLLRGQSGDVPARPDFRVSYYPMAECLNAFDGAVGAAGYNTVQELLHFGVPSVLIPRARGLDDQFERAKRAESAGAAIVSDLRRDAVFSALTRLADESVRHALSAHAAATAVSNGAEPAAAAIVGLL